MTPLETGLDGALRRLLPGAAQRSRVSWSAAFRNGSSHPSLISIEDGVVVIATGPLPLDATPERALEINARLPEASRIVCGEGGRFHLRAEWASGEEADAADQLCQAAFDDFRAALDTVSGDSEARLPSPPPRAAEPPAPAEHWNARRENDGGWRIALSHGHRVLRASASLVTSEIAPSGPYPAEVRFAIAELLLRTASRLRFVKACAAAGEAGNWSAWIQVPVAACGVDEALTAAALVSRDCAEEAKALTDQALALRYREVASLWPAGSAVRVSSERR